MNALQLLTAISKELEKMQQLIADNKPNDRTESDRRIAIVATELEKLTALVTHYAYLELEKKGAREQ